LTEHWKDELIELKRGLKELQQKRKSFRITTTQTEPVITHVPIHKILPGKEPVIRATITGKDLITSCRVGYSNKHSVYNYINMEQRIPYICNAVIPGLEVTEELNYFIEASDTDSVRVTYPKNECAHPITVLVTNYNMPPILLQQPITSAPAAKQLKIADKVRDPSGVKMGSPAV